MVAGEFSEPAWEFGTTFIPMSQMKKSRHREAEKLAQSHSEEPVDRVKNPAVCVPWRVEALEEGFAWAWFWFLSLVRSKPIGSSRPRLDRGTTVATGALLPGPGSPAQTPQGS